MDVDFLSTIARSARVQSARLSPDGEHVATLRTEDGRTEAFIGPADGSSAARRLTAFGVARVEHGDAGPSWSPDGTRVATLSAGDDGSDVVVVDVATGVARALTDGHRSCASPRWSPDGRWIAYLVTRPPTLRTLEDGPHAWDVAIDDDDPGHLTGAHGLVALHIASADGSRVLRFGLPDASFLDCDWHLDSEGIVAVAIDPKTAAGRLVSLDVGATGAVRTLAPSDGQQYRSPRIGPDGQLAYLSDRSGFFEAYVRERPEEVDSERSLSGDRHDKTDLQWASDGTLLVTEAAAGLVRLALVDPRDASLGRTLASDGVVTSLSRALGRARIAYLIEASEHPPRVRVADLDDGTNHESLDVSVSGVVSHLATTFEVRRYAGADGLEVEGFLALPEAATDEPPPLIVYAHGGPTSAHLRGWHPFLNWLTKQGYAVFAPNFRGSTLYGRAFERANDEDWGGGDLGDVVRAVEVLREEGLVDPQRAAIYGGSYGGYLTLLALTKRPEVFRCGVSLYAVSNRYSSWLTTDRSGRHNMEKEMGPMALRREAYREASPLYFLDRITAPLLVLHGEDDPRVPFGQSLELVDGLKRAGAFHIFASYPGEGHGFQRPEHVTDAYSRITAFLKSFL